MDAVDVVSFGGSLHHIDNILSMTDTYMDGTRQFEGVHSSAFGQLYPAFKMVSK